MSTLLYKGYTDADKAALKELKAEVEKKLGAEVRLADMIAAVEPSLPTPDSLKGC